MEAEEFVRQASQEAEELGEARGRNGTAGPQFVENRQMARDAVSQLREKISHARSSLNLVAEFGFSKDEVRRAEGEVGAARLHLEGVMRLLRDDFVTSPGAGGAAAAVAPVVAPPAETRVSKKYGKVELPDCTADDPGQCFGKEGIRKVLNMEEISDDELEFIRRSLVSMLRRSAEAAQGRLNAIRSGVKPSRQRVKNLPLDLIVQNLAPAFAAAAAAGAGGP